VYYNQAMESPSKELVELLRGSENTVALTGAGISKSAGIPTFRDLDDGLWLDRENLRWAHRQTYDKDPQEWYVKFWQLYGTMRAARPTPAHYALRDMVEASVVHTVVTQNIDGLDLLAGTDESNLLEVHGHDRVLSCTDLQDCGYFIRTEDWLLGSNHGDPVTCLRDDKPLKPDIMLFEDTGVPSDIERNFLKGQPIIDDAEVLLVIGTTLEIRAWNQAVRKFGDKDGKPVVAINPNTSRADDYARFIIHHAADEVLPAIRDQVIG